MSDSKSDAAARLRAAMEADNGSPPELWNPSEGEYLVATFVRYETRYSKKMNADVNVAVVYDEEADTWWSVWLSREVLKREFERQAPREGDLCGIKYHGRKRMPDGTDGYHRYSMQVRRDPDVGVPAVPVSTLAGDSSGPGQAQPAAVGVTTAAPAATNEPVADDDELPW
jgi:hypothetical protein